MILATEIGDKTFFIAAVLSMRHDRSAVFTGAIVALIIMTILSSAMGLCPPAIRLIRRYHILGGMLFLYFGVKLLYESKQMRGESRFRRIGGSGRKNSCIPRRMIRNNQMKKIRPYPHTVPSPKPPI
jgi:putative Ca2+/H+ antiporter (TMEM165/GDT1 family)